MADAAMADAAAPPPPAVTYATLPYNGTTLVVEARWHDDASVDVQLTDGAAVWRKPGVCMPAGAAEFGLTPREWAADARGALAEGRHALECRPRDAGLQLAWTVPGAAAARNTGTTPLLPLPAPAPALHALLCGTASSAAASSAAAARSAATAAALRAELAATSAQASQAVAAKAASEEDLYRKFALVLNEKKKRLAAVLAERDEAVEAAAELRARPRDSADADGQETGDDASSDDSGAPGGSGDTQTQRPPASQHRPAAALLPPPQPRATQAALPLPPARAALPAPSAGPSLGRNRARIKREPAASGGASMSLAQSEDGAVSQQPRVLPGRMRCSALETINLFASMAADGAADDDDDEVM